MRLGGNTYINTPILVACRGQSLFTLKRHDNFYLGIYFDIFDERGKRIAAVRRNEIYFGDKEAYDIDGSATRYRFFERKPKRMICDIKRYEEAHPTELDVSVRLYTPSGFLFEGDPDHTNLSGHTLSGCTFTDCAVGINIE